MNNTGFELGLTDWNTLTGTPTITSDAFAGNSALALSGGQTGVNQGFSVIAGETYTLSSYGKTTESDWSGIGVNFFDQNWNLLEKSSTRITSQDWATYTVEAIAPVGTSRGRLWAWTGGNTGTTVVDELTVSGSTPLPPPPTDELLTNASFETGLSDWNGFSGTETLTPDAFDGSQALQLSKVGSGANQTVSVTSGETYQLSGYAKTNINAWTGWGLRFRASDGTALETNQVRITTPDWGLYEIEGIAPANATQAEVYIWNGGDSGSTELDGVSLQQVTGAGNNQAPTIVSNGGDASAALTIEENSSAIANIDTTDPDGETAGNGLTYTLSPNSVLSLADLVPASVNIQDGFIIDPSKFTADPARLLESGIRVERDSPDSNTLINVGSSSNGLVEYTGDAFGGELNGDLLVAQFNGNIGRLDLNATGTAATYETISGLSGLSVPLDVHLGPNGTIWATEIGGDFIKVFAPSDLVIPGDPDADDDGIFNVDDPFIRDASNGASAVVIPGQTLLWDFDANQDDNLPGPDGYGGGLTGVMINGITDFEEFFQEPSSLPGQDINLDNVKFITAAGGGTTVIETVSAGDTIATQNAGEYLFHTGVTIAPTVDTFTIKWTVFNPGSDLAEAFQQIGGYIGTGDQSNYLKLVAVQGNPGEIELLLEDSDVVQSQSFLQADDLFNVPVNSNKIFFELTVDPNAATATPTITYETATGNQVVTGNAISLAGTAVLEAIQGNYTVNGQTTGLAVGLYSSNNGALPQPDFQAIFDDIEITTTGSTDSTVLYRVNTGGEAIASLDSGPDWAADTTSNPSPFLVEPGSNSSANFPLLDPGDTVPGNIPGTIFDTERWEGAGGPEMQWEFAVPSGVYEVRLFMGNGWSGANDPGERVFDVAIEDTVFGNVNDVDLSAQLGHEVGGLFSNTVTVTDGLLNLEFLHVVENPLINGIEILQLG